MATATKKPKPKLTAKGVTRYATQIYHGAAEAQELLLNCEVPQRVRGILLGIQELAERMDARTGTIDPSKKRKRK